MKKFIFIPLLLILSACGGGSSVTPPISMLPSPTPIPTPIQPNAFYTALGDSITYGLYATSIQTQAYPVVLAGKLQAILTNLGIPGEYSGGVLQDEISKIPVGTQIITLFIGTNDELEVVNKTNTPAAVEATFAANMQTISATLHKEFPGASIYVANLPNLANLPAWKTADPSIRTTLSNLNSVLNTVIDQMGFPVVDLRCATGVYDPTNYYNNGQGDLGNVHPNTKGHAYYASIFYATMARTLTESQICAYRTLQ